tara:strand:- start:11304 stop:11903 length:600 start_codon:yes stop_codon:yes gene_type:complete
MLKNIFTFVLVLFLYFSNIIVYSSVKDNNDISEYLNSLKQFSCNFIQANPDGSVSEGNLLYFDKKLKINYIKPTNIIFVVKKNRAMYFNKDLEEVRYFNPENSILDILDSLFEIDKLAEEDYKISRDNNVITIFMDTEITDEIINYKIIFQNNPIALKKIKWKNQNNESSFSIFDISTNVEINKKTFSLANPLPPAKSN